MHLIMVCHCLHNDTPQQKPYAISEYMFHDATAVHAYIKTFLESFLSDVAKVDKVHYFSNDAISQYKNEKFTSLCFHKEDFEVTATWSFFITSHGSGPCDGADDALERLAAKASLLRPLDDQILSPCKFFLGTEKE